MRVASFDAGITHVGMVIADVSQRDNAVAVREARCVDLADVAHRRVPRAACALSHSNSLASRFAHFMQEFEPTLREAELVLVEQQPPGSAGCVFEQLLLFALPSKARTVHPRSVHAFFRIGHLDYEARKSAAERIARPHLAGIDTSRASRMHDIADALCILLFHTAQAHKQQLAQRRAVPTSAPTLALLRTFAFDGRAPLLRVGGASADGERRAAPRRRMDDDEQHLAGMLEEFEILHPPLATAARPPAAAGPPPLRISAADVRQWADLIVRDAEDGLRKVPMAQARFPQAMLARFDTLRIMQGSTEPSEGRCCAADEQRAVVSSLATMTLLLAAAAADDEQDGAALRRFAALIRGEAPEEPRCAAMLGASVPPAPLADSTVVEWGRRLGRRADTDERRAASYLTLVLHDLHKCSIASQHRAASDGATVAAIMAAAVADERPAGLAVPLHDVRTCRADLRDAMRRCFETDFELAQLVQGEATAAEAAPLAALLRDRGDCAWFVDHYALDAAGVQAKSDGYIGTKVIDQNSYDAFTSCEQVLLGGGEAAERAYLERRLRGVDPPAVCALAATLDLPVERTERALGRMAAMVRAYGPHLVSRLCAAWCDAVARFQMVAMRALAQEMTADGAAAVRLKLKYGPLLLHCAAKDGVQELVLTLGALGSVVIEQRAAVEAAQREAGPEAVSNPTECDVRPLHAGRCCAEDSAEGPWARWFAAVRTGAPVPHAPPLVPQ